jgi:hypothetical protein
MIANCLVDTGEEVTSKVRILNPFNRTVQLYQDTWIGKAEEIEGEVITLPEEPDFIDGSTSTLCQINTKKAPVTVPEHLQDLFNRASEDKSLEEKELIISFPRLILI